MACIIDSSQGSFYENLGITSKLHPNQSSLPMQRAILGSVYLVCESLALKTTSPYGFLSASWETFLTAHSEQLPAHLKDCFSKRGEVQGRSTGQQVLQIPWVLGVTPHPQLGWLPLTKILTLVFDNSSQVKFHQLLFWVGNYGRNVSRFQVAIMPP